MTINIIKLAQEAGMRWEGGFTRVIACVDEAELVRNATLDAAQDAEADSASAVRVLVELFGPDAHKGIDVLKVRWRKEIERAERLAEALEEIHHTANTSLWKNSDARPLRENPQ